MKFLPYFSFLIFLFISINSHAGNVLNSSWSDVVNGKCSDQNTAWWSSAEAIRIAENVLLYQRDNGGWPKNTDMQLILSQSEKDKLIADKSSTAGGYCTIDNGAVKYELKYLSTVYAALADETYKSTIKTGFLKGIDYLLNIQFDNGGWPQFFPFRSSTSYSNNITYNDNAMINVMEILRHIYQKDSEYSIVANENTITRSQTAFDKGVECILNTQYTQSEILTVWCAQHDYKTLEPVMARSYELASLSGGESAGIISLLMSLDQPSFEIRRSIYYAVNWYNKARIVGKRLESFTNSDGLSDKRLISDPKAPDMWARFYTLDTSTPFFCDRDGIMVFSIAEIGHERRNGYSWYGNYGNSVFSDYTKWFAKWGASDEQETVLRSPKLNAEYSPADTIYVSANANEYKIGSIQKFELFLDTQLIHQFNSSVIDTFLTNTSPGAHTLTIQSTDDIGNILRDSASFSVSNAFQLTINNGSGSGNYAEGTEVSIIANEAPNGELFLFWTGDTTYITDVNSESILLIMPAFNVSLTANYGKDNTGISSNNFNNKAFRCYPNPAGASFSIDLKNMESAIMELFNFSGQLVYHAEVKKGIHQINEHGLRAGVYFVKVSSKNKQSFTQRIIIK
ncbi:MAG: pectate lyase [Prolixibacteraceae bacterium]